nr:hypothetical protein [Candidatus Levybacteria bacterium]
MAMPSGKKILLLGFVVVLLIAIPLIIYLVSLQQNAKTSTVPSTSLSFTPASQSVDSGANTSFDININPGSNSVSFVKIYINYDDTKLATEGAGFVPNTTSFRSVVQGPVFEPGKISFTLSIGASAPPITSSTKIGTLTFKALNTTSPASTQVGFGNQTQVLSVGTTDQFNENLLLNSSSATINITALIPSPTPKVSIPTPTTVPTGQATSSGISLATPASAAGAPICSSFTADRALTGIAPYNINFTLIGTSSADILKATFNFGDGQVTELTQANGIGQTSVNSLTSHVYRSAGTFSAFGTITDVNGAVSQVGTCTLILTINPSEIASGSGVPNPSPLPPTGPSNFIAIGAIGFFITILGVILLLAL